MKLKSWIFGLTFIAASLGVCAAARANQTICVDNAVGANLFNSLQQWANTGTGTTTIKVAAGTYNISVVLVQFSSGSLNLFGGYAPGTSCDEAQRDLAAYTTILEGGGSGVFYVEPVAALTIDGFTLRNYTGSNAQYSVQGVTIETVTSAANLAVTRFVAQGDSTVYFHNGGGDSNGSIVVENCLVYGQPNNTAAGTAALHISTWGNNAYVVNCTVADNHISGLELETQNTASAFVYNSIAYSNGKDIFTGNVGNPPSVAYSMYFNATSANIVSANQHNIVLISTSPGFVSPGSDYHLLNSSPAINVGTPVPAPLFLPATDIAGHARQFGSAPDMGAYESQVNNLTPIVVTNTMDDNTPGSLRWAMNSAPANSKISFNLGTSCPYAIKLQSPLPDVTVKGLFIDGTTQAGWSANSDPYDFNATICVYVVSSQSVAYALHVPSSAPSITTMSVRGLGFAGFNDAAIKLEGGTNHSITGNEFTPLVANLGLLGVGPNQKGIYLSGNALTSVIGSATDPALINLIADSSGEAIHIDSITGAASHLVAGNLIGVSPDGICASGNGTGIRIDNAQGNVLENNLIGNNTAAGIIINGPSAYANVVRGNIIGETPNNVQAAGNKGPGVLIENGSYNNRVGALPGDYSGANVINFNGTQGVFVSNGGVGNLLLANTLGFNTGLAIDLGAAGPTPNQNPQASSPNQPNELQNFPVVSNAFRTQATEWVQGSVTTFANQTVQIDVYAAPGCSAAGHTLPLRGAGGVHEGFVTVHTDANGVANFWMKLNSLGPQNYPFPYTFSATASAISGHNDTSEIGTCTTESNDMIFRDDLGG